VEVDPNARPIVCKIMDWGRAKYDLAKKEKAAKRHEKVLSIKQVKFRPGIDGHDFETKLAHARRFLEEGKRTKVTIMFRRRDLRRPENGVKILKRVANELTDVGKVETRPGKIENRDLTMVMVPLLGIGNTVKDAARKAEELKATASAKKTAGSETAAPSASESAAATPAAGSESKAPAKSAAATAPAEATVAAAPAKKATAAAAPPKKATAAAAPAKKATAAAAAPPSPEPDEDTAPEEAPAEPSETLAGS
jgi:translation initiation factor IF-3